MDKPNIAVERFKSTTDLSPNKIANRVSTHMRNDRDEKSSVGDGRDAQATNSEMLISNTEASNNKLSLTTAALA